MFQYVIYVPARIGLPQSKGKDFAEVRDADIIDIQNK
jgi:hypothetical protein